MNSWRGLRSSKSTNIFFYIIGTSLSSTLKKAIEWKVLFAFYSSYHFMGNIRELNCSIQLYSSYLRCINVVRKRLANEFCVQRTWLCTIAAGNYLNILIQFTINSRNYCQAVANEQNKWLEHVHYSRWRVTIRHKCNCSWTKGSIHVLVSGKWRVFNVYAE